MASAARGSSPQACNLRPVSVFVKKYHVDIAMITAIMASGDNGKPRAMLMDGRVGIDGEEPY